MTIKERILQEIEDSSPILLEEFLNFILFTKQRRQPQLTQNHEGETDQEMSKRQSPSQVKALKNWFENTEPTSSEFDPEQAKWEYLKEKHNL